MIVSIGHSFRKILKNPKAPGWKQTQSRGAAQALSLSQSKASRGVLLEMFCHRVGRGKAEITENPEKFIEQFGVSCVSQDGWREGKEEADPR